MAEEAASFFSRWSRRKADARVAEVPPADDTPTGGVAGVTAAAVPPIAVAAAALPTVDAQPGTGEPEAAPPPTLEDVARLTPGSDYAPFVARNVSPEVRNAALKHLFTDPHYNVMDGLDIYIGDYNTPDPLPAGMLRQMVQSTLLGLFDDEETGAADGPATVPPSKQASTPSPTDPALSISPSRTEPADEDPDLQLQPDDDAGRTGAQPGAGAHAGRAD